MKEIAENTESSVYFDEEYGLYLGIIASGILARPLRRVIADVRMFEVWIIARKPALVIIMDVSIILQSLSCVGIIRAY